MGNQCRFYPSCSHYGEQAIEHHGAIKGGALTVWRILRCNPWNEGGFDYVPGTEPEPDSEINELGNSSDRIDLNSGVIKE